MEPARRGAGSGSGQQSERRASPGAEPAAHSPEEEFFDVLAPRRPEGERGEKPAAPWDPDEDSQLEYHSADEPEGAGARARGESPCGPPARPPGARAREAPPPVCGPPDAGSERGGREGDEAGPLYPTAPDGRAAPAGGSLWVGPERRASGGGPCGGAASRSRPPGRCPSPPRPRPGGTDTDGRAPGASASDDTDPESSRYHSPLGSPARATPKAPAGSPGEARAGGAEGTASRSVDAAADFRAGFTVSRAVAARCHVASKSSNTEITMMDGQRPDLRARGGALEKAAPAQGETCFHDSLQLRGASDDTDLEAQPKGDSGKLSWCCQKVMQRAVAAELHLLDLHYELCQRHCGDVHRLVADSRGLSSASTKKELGSVLFSILRDVEVRYVSLKAKLSEGAALSELPPLSIESTLLSAFSEFVSKLMKEDSQIVSGADSERAHQGTRDGGDADFSPGLRKTFSRISLAADSYEPRQPPPPKEGVLGNIDVDIDLSQLRLGEQGHKAAPEVSEDWFDARESLTGTDFPGAQQSVLEPARGEPEPEPEPTRAGAPAGEPVRGDRGHATHAIHVGGLGPTISEADLRAHFQKYQVCTVSICDSPAYRFATLTLKRSGDARAAAREMNGASVGGRPVNVRLLKSPGEPNPAPPCGKGSRTHPRQPEEGRGPRAAAPPPGPPRTRPRRPAEPDLEQGPKKSCRQVPSAQLLPESPAHHLPANTLDLRSFTRILRRLAELHPGVSREGMISALQAVRRSHKGFLHGLPINTIVDMTSSALKNPASG